MKLPTAITDSVRKLVNRRLNKVLATLHIYDANPNLTALSAWLHFEGVEPAHFYGSADGRHLVVDNEQPKAFKMGQYGEVVVSDISEASLFRDLIGRSLFSIFAVTAPQAEDLVGFRLNFENSEHFYLFNWGDELLITKEYPKDAAEELVEKKIR